MRTVVYSFILIASITLMVSAGASAQRSSSGASASMTGGITINAAFIPGAEKLLVTGTAPSGSVVFLSLMATFDPSVPTVVVNRMDVVAARNGRFRAVLPYASAAETIAVLSVQASSWNGRSTATACCFSLPGPQTPLSFVY
ncbi:MAG TPA: hypothetical protein VIJ12_00875 [Candidatus Baltobacteraceae bacterium]